MAKLPLPDFKTEAEEADWYYEHRDSLDDYFERVNDPRSFAQMLLEDHNIVIDPNTVTLSLPAGDLQLARQQAASRGVEDEKYLADLIHRALHSEAA